MKDKETLLLSTTCFFAGVVVGFLIAPIKKGVYCGNNSGNNSGNQYKELKEKNEEEINEEETELSLDVKI